MNENIDIPFRGIVEQSLAGMYVIQDEVFQYVNATFAGMLGYTVAEMIGMPLSEAVIPESRPETLNNYHRRIRGEVPSIRYITIGQHKQGPRVYLEVHGANLLYRGRPAVVGVGINITEQVHQQEELQQSRERLRELAAYINTAREEQRARIARELHDVVGGMLTSIKMDIQRINRRSHDPELKNIVTGLLQLVQDSISTVRTISEDLRPGVLDHLGLQEALRAVLREFAERTEIPCQLLLADDFSVTLTQACETAIYRICQEALTNIARHAHATKVIIELSRTSDQLTVVIEDNGRGISNPPSNSKGMGLIGMVERAREFGGTLTVQPGTTGGTCLILNLPVDDSHD